ncbi:fungal-specific transcription factor domain-containing protein [Aspergillus granulosus]|uniref:Fungal-specific transcription factor domain-containing protein n=1 Tax=Aspergillus granulosus TaxID=176169 RepID=A0ABR4HD43_9EURO
MDSFPNICGYRRIKRASRACQRCHARKVRCDATVSGFPCTNCRLDTFPCQAFTGGRERRKQLSLIRARALASEAKKQSAPCRARTITTKARGAHAVEMPYSSYTFIQSLDIGELELDGLLIMERSGCLMLPDKSEIDVLVRHYFLYVHPFTPLVDEAVFWRVYKSPRPDDDLIPLFLFRAMIFAASCFVPIELATRCGYGSLLDARDDLYQKAKLLYDSGLVKDPLIVSKATLLLTYYSSDFDVYSNSQWLHIAIKEANMVRASHLVPESFANEAERSEFKRLWWCCLIRDRIISLGMRRPLQITLERGHPYIQMLTTNDMNDEIFGSLEYSYETKSALFELLTSLCHFATAVTELLTIAFPSPQQTRSGVDDPCSGLDKLDSAKSTLLLWELDWMTYMEGKNASLHPSIPLFSSLFAIYYHYRSARVALCNCICIVLGRAEHHKRRYLQQLQLCQAELVAAIACIADKVRQLIIIDAVDKLPISIAAYTMTPYVLLTMDSQSDSKKSREIMVLFNAVNQTLSLRYHITRVSNLTSRALWLSRLFKGASMRDEAEAETLSEITPRSNLFTLPLQQYTRLLRYIDESMSIPQDSLRETEILYAAASAAQELSLHDTSELPTRELTPVWIEAMDNFFFGPGSALSLLAG